MTNPHTQTSAALLAMLLFLALPNPSPAQLSSRSSTNYSVSGPVVEGYCLAISTSNNTYAAGQLVPLAISVRNLSTNAGWLSVRSGYWLYSFEVAGPGGLPASITGYGTNVLHPLGGSLNTSVEVPAGESYSVHAPLSLLFNMTNPGEYMVTVCRQVPKREGPYREVCVRAGPLKIVITKPQNP